LYRVLKYQLEMPRSLYIQINSITNGDKREDQFNLFEACVMTITPRPRLTPG